MGADTWFRSDLVKILRSKAVAASRDIADQQRREGYLAALFDLGVEFGIELPAGSPWRHWLAGDGNLVGDGNEVPIEAR